MTGAELEAAAADSVRDLFRHRNQPFTRKGEPCANCATPLEGRYCHACGQTTDTRHRSIMHLIWEAIEGMFHLDGRLARTLPLLFQTLRGGYGSTIPGAVFKTLVVWFTSATAFGVLLVALMFFSLTQI